MFVGRRSPAVRANAVAAGPQAGAAPEAAAAAPALPGAAALPCAPAAAGALSLSSWH